MDIPIHFEYLYEQFHLRNLDEQFALQSIEPIAKVNSAAGSFSMISDHSLSRSCNSDYLLSFEVWTFTDQMNLPHVDFLLAITELHVHVSLFSTAFS